MTNNISYMDRPEELEKYAGICAANGFNAPANGARGLCEAMAGGNADLFDAMWKIWNFENAFDDLIDQIGINGELKVVAIAGLHDAIVELMTDGHRGTDKLKKFLEVWRFLEGRATWSKQRKILAAMARNQFFGMLRLNPFVRQHAAALETMLVQAMLRCISGDLMAASDDPRKRALAPAVRCGDVDLFMHMIYLARGFAAASVWCGKLGYDLPDSQTPEAGSQRPETEGNK